MRRALLLGAAVLVLLVAGAVAVVLGVLAGEEATEADAGRAADARAAAREVRADRGPDDQTDPADDHADDPADDHAVGQAAAPAPRPLRTGERFATLRMPRPYTPSAPTGTGTDDYRCFVLDPGLQRDAFVTGLDVRPGTPRRCTT